MPEPSFKPVQLLIEGKPWSLIFAPHPTLLDKQGIWLFNHETGEFWELIANDNFVLRPRLKEGRGSKTPRRGDLRRR
jgi:hypothetical protein